MALLQRHISDILCVIMSFFIICFHIRILFFRKNDGCRIQVSGVNFRFKMLSHFCRSSGGASYPVLRNAPPRYLSSGEAHRLVNMATKLLVATVRFQFCLKIIGHMLVYL